jgi:hypothetical protein
VCRTAGRATATFTQGMVCPCSCCAVVPGLQAGRGSGRTTDAAAGAGVGLGAAAAQV